MGFAGFWYPGRAVREWVARFLFAVVGWAAVAGCGEPTYSLVVDVTTDLSPAEEFSSIRVQRFASLEDLYIPGRTAAEVQDLVATPGASYADGVRAAEFGDLPAGDHFLRVDLLDDAQAVLVSRQAIVAVAANVVANVVMTRSCIDVNCADRLQTCVGGRCADPACLPETGERCPPPQCQEDGDCAAPAATCADVRCRAGTCLSVGRDEACPDGLWCDPATDCRERGVPLLDATSCDDVHAGALWCRGFEGGVVAGWAWSLDVDPETNEVYRGQGAALAALETSELGGLAYAKVGAALPATSEGRLYARVYYFFPGEASFAHLGVLSLGSLDVAEDQVVLRSETLQLLAGPGTYGSSRPTPRDRWTCLEYMVDVETGERRLWLDGELVAEGRQAPPSAAVDVLQLGINWTSELQLQRVSLLFDEVVVDRSPIGCD